MDTRDLSALSCRVLALYFVLITLTSLTWMIPSLFGTEEALLFVTSYAVNTLVTLGVAFTLWRYAPRIATWLTPNPSDVNIGALSFQQVQRLAFSVVGLIFAVQGAADVLQVIADGLFAPAGFTNSFVRPVSGAVRLTLGLGLLLGMDNLMGLLGRPEQNRVPQSDVEES